MVYIRACMSPVMLICALFLGSCQERHSEEGARRGGAQELGPWLEMRLGEARLFLCSEGARIDQELSYGSGNHLIVMLPCNRGEVLRLLEALPGLERSASIGAAPRPLTVRNIRYSTDGCERTFSVGVGQPGANFLLEGLIREILVSAHWDLVTAIMHQRHAAALAGAGVEDGASAEYMRAFQMLVRWADGRVPRVKQEGLIDDFFAHQVARAISEHQERDGQLSAASGAKVWGNVSREVFGVHWDGNVGVVSFFGNTLHTRDLPLKLSPQVVAELRQVPFRLNP